MPLRLEGATARRRLCAGLIDAACCALIAALPYLLGLLTLDGLTPPEGLFLSDHLLILLTERREVYTLPLTWWVTVWGLWQFSWLYFNTGRTLGGVVLKIQAVDTHGDPLSLWRALARASGHALSALSLGLGWLWALVSPSRRAWPDLVSDSFTVRR